MCAFVPVAEVFLGLEKAAVRLCSAQLLQLIPQSEAYSEKYSSMGGHPHCNRQLAARRARIPLLCGIFLLCGLFLGILPPDQVPQALL